MAPLWPAGLVLAALATLVHSTGLHKRQLQPDELLGLPTWQWNADGFSIDKFDTHVLQSPVFQNLDPSFMTHGSSYDWVTSDVHEHTVIRIRPQINGIRVHGAERIFSFHRPSGQWSSVEIGHHLHREHNRPLGSTLAARASGDDFDLSADEALAFARAHTFHRSTGISGYSAEKLYFADSVSGDLVPCWKIIDLAEPSPSRKIRWVDARTGNILATLSTATHDQGLVYPEPNMVQLGTPATQLALRDVQSPTQYNGGLGIVGADFRSFNTCFRYGCFNQTAGTANGNCTEDYSYCSNATSNYATRPYYFTTDGRYLDYYRDWEADGYVDGNIHMLWTEAPVFAPNLKQPDNKIWGTDVDFTQTDVSRYLNFVELQAYYYFTEHVAFMRNLLQSPNLCLVGTGANCTQMDPVTNRTATHWDKPMRFVVNYQSMQTAPGPDDTYDDFLTQLSKGLGKNDSAPIVFYNSTSYEDAFFSNSQFQSLINDTDFRDCSNGSCVSIMESPFDYFAFGLNSMYSWALADCTVFHELTHAFVAKFVPDLPSYIYGSKGLMSDPGALNEGWADYFAAIHCNRPDFRTQYNGRPYRSVINDMTCADMVGEIHADSGVFSGALWEIRSNIPQLISGNATDNQMRFDRLVLHALALATITETFTAQFTKIQSLVEQDAILSPLKALSLSIFETRELNCTRVMAYTEANDSTYTLPDARTTSRNVSTPPSQMYISPRPSDWRATIFWMQLFNSPFLGPLTSGFAAVPLRYAVSYGCPIFSFANDSLYADCSHDNTTSPCAGYDNSNIQWHSAIYNNDTKDGRIDIAFAPASCNRIYVWVSHQIPAPITLYSTNLTYMGWHRIWLWTLVLFGLIEFAVLLSLLVYSTVYGLKRCLSARSRKPKSEPVELLPVPDDLGGRDISREALVTPVISEPVSNSGRYAFWTKPRQRNPARRGMWIWIGIMFLGDALFLAMTAFGLVAIYYPPWRPPLAWALFIPIYAAVVIDLGMLFLGQKRLWNDLELPPRLSTVRRVWLIADASAVVFTTLGMTLVVLSTAGVALHAVVYCMFLASMLGRSAAANLWFITMLTQT
ncbi:uncharacterized protein BJ171DRAFT_259476 [Polychytrium aggregatum]|uniref:uncharacterized protein n=1 Tax=Polychytrium aggregatum TaxID=110093 RepID=UPI0022FE953F|nr:uncharacterized protein BJ171DRAFT_259476 [Polychytrium aggregatum]KAI9208011.1 hypothetical protein BJ171DRAFT_259476 [Polychytrium aggregatum]